MKTTVVHVNDPAGFDIYIGRAVPRKGFKASKWANPEAIGSGSRSAVIHGYRAYLESRPSLKYQVVSELKGKVLGCWCAPKACHGDVLAEIADSDYDEPLTTVEVLTAARELISDPSRWSDGPHDTDAAGAPVFSLSLSAQRWTAQGAITRVSLGADAFADQLLADVALRLHQADISTVNTTMAHAAIMQTFDYAIKAARAASVKGGQP